MTELILNTKQNIIKFGYTSKTGTICKKRKSRAKRVNSNRSKEYFSDIISGQ